MSPETAADPYAPHPTAESAFFWEGLDRGELLLPFCTAGEHYFFPPMPGCPRCGAGLEQVEHRRATGRGVLYSWIVAHYAFDRSFADEVPYAVVTVTLAEGPRIYGRWLGDGSELVADVDVVADTLVRGGTTVLAFRPARGGDVS